MTRGPPRHRTHDSGSWMFQFQKGHPATVTRTSSNSIISTLKDNLSRPSSETRLILQGPRGSGKSMIMLQAISAMWQNDAIVIYIPQAQHLINSGANYRYSTETHTFHQPQLSVALMKSMLAANRSALSQIKTEKEFTSSNDTVIPVGETLDNVIQGPGTDERISAEVLEFVMDTLATQTSHPVVLAVDEVQCLFMRSDYRSPTFEFLQSYALSLPRLLGDYVSGRKSFANGAVITALSYSTPAYTPGKEIYKGLKDLYPNPYAISEYDNLDPYQIEAVKSLQIVQVGDKLALDEARGILHLCEKRKMVFHGEYLKVVCSSQEDHCLTICGNVYSHRRVALEQAR